jgi:hypothetical protein
VRGVEKGDQSLLHSPTHIPALAPGGKGVVMMLRHHGRSCALSEPKLEIGLELSRCLQI